MGILATGTRRGLILGLVVPAASIATASLAQPRYEATITRTTHHIPHITSESWQGVGYGVAYAYAQDNLCLLAEEFATVAGERSLHFGPDGTTMLGRGDADNLTSDIFHRSQIDLPRLRAGFAEQSQAVQQLTQGYVAGYNRYLRDTAMDAIPKECRGKAWLRPITVDDALRLTEKQMLLASSLALAAGIATAAPPGSGVAAADISFPTDDEPRFGSNGWAFGSEATADGRGLVIGNPHFPWEGPGRFWQLHVTGPDGYDVMGATLAGGPIPTLGFNRDVAWTHTVTAARHFAVYALTLSPDDPTTYILDGNPVKMQAREISVPMPDGAPPVVRTLYSTAFGAVVTVPSSGVQWNRQQAFAISDANMGNQRALDTWLQIGKARNVSDITNAVSGTLGIPWVNTIAADRDGKALHADITAVPTVDAELVGQCSTPFSALVAAQVTLLDGSRSECDWRRGTNAPVNALLSADDQAARIRSDYVTNSNDSYWISNPRDQYRALSPILGSHATALSLRTRSNFQETEAALAEAKMDHSRAKALVFANKSLAAEMVVQPLLELCADRPDVAKPCAALAGWDRRFDVDSKGAYLFVAFWRKIMNRPDLWQVPFDAQAPLTTPRDLSTADATQEALIAALSAAAADLEEAGIALDAPVGKVMTRPLRDEDIAIHGGPGYAGVLNMQEGREIAGGYTPRHGSSYIQIVGFDDDGPVAEAVLSYSQSSNPASPYYADQTRAYSAKRWHRLPFNAAEIDAQTIGEPLTLSE